MPYKDSPESRRMLQETHPCKCGCGTIILKHKMGREGYFAGAIRLYVNGHFLAMQSRHEGRWKPPDTGMKVEDNCLKCGSQSTYIETGSDKGIFFEVLCCHMCGNRTYPPIILGKGKHEC